MQPRRVVLSSAGGRFGKWVVLPIAGLVAAASILVVSFVLMSASRQDSLALESSKRLAQTAFDVKKREIARNLKDYAVWEDAYHNLHVSLNLDWAATDGNVGANIYNSLGYDMAFAIAAGNKTVYAVLEGEPQRADALSLVPGIEDLLRGASHEEKPAVGLLRSGRDILLVAATAILSPSEMVEKPKPADRSVLVFVKKLNAEFLQRISTEYLLANLTVVMPGEATLGASLPLASADGVNLGEVTWRPEEPGKQLLRTLVPPLVLSLVGLAAGGALFSWLALRDARRAAEAIEASAEKVEAYAQTLETSQARFRDVAEASSDWIWETDPELRFTYFSSRFGDVTGIAAAAVLGKTLEQFFSSDTETDGWENMLRNTESQSTFRDVRCCYRDAQGSSRFCRLAGRPILDQNGTTVGYRGTATDITREVEANAKANHLALHDALTELPNRVLLRERLNAALSLCQKENATFALLCLDLDHFKRVNDTLGHGAGDMLLREVADRLRGCTRSTDTVARLGGDEFAIVQVNPESPDDTTALCRRILDCMNAPFLLEGQEFHVGCSIGVVVAPDDGDDHERLHKNADIALYRVKQAGRGAFRFFEPQMDVELQARKALEQDLRQALGKSQFELHFQPQVTVDGEHLSGAEALLRWRHPEHGVVSPAEFVPLAEETGLITSIGKWALTEACIQAKKWPGISVAVNLSAVQFKKIELVEMVRAALLETGIDPQRLELEITETVLLYDTAAALSILNDLKRARRQGGDGRFRHRIFLDGVSQLIPVRQDQDRQVVHHRSEHIGQIERDRQIGHQSWTEPRHGDDSGRGRNARTAGVPAERGVPTGAGSLLQSLPSALTTSRVSTPTGRSPTALYGGLRVRT